MRNEREKLKKSSVYVKDWINRQPAVKEESLTDWLLYDVSTNISSITYKAFTRHEEARKTGADWEWWFLFEEFSAKFRIQAKMIHPATDNYPSIAYTNKYGLQIEKLIQDAKNKNFIPLYALYTCLEEKTLCQKRMNINYEGVYLSGANKIHNDFILNGKQVIQPSDLMKRSIPLSCILSYPRCFHNGTRGFHRFLSHYFSEEIKVERQNEPSSFIHGCENIPGIHSQIPKYITSFIEHSEKGLPDGWEQKFGDDLEGANSLLVHDFRKK